ncbi:MAG: phytanoyl-CoA dioxygenase family protein [Pseudomonadales bacterium]|nr:phytanoyl-CoA dioxygenase family protein [Pseudomonadales bacterium]
MPEPVLNATEIAEFHDRGVLKFDFGFESAQLDRVIEGVESLYDNPYRDKPEIPTRVQDAWKQVDDARQLAVNQRVLHALEQLVERKPLPFQTLNFPIGTSQYAHSDTIHFSTIPEGYMAGVWVALEDIDLDNGPLIYYPGSHKLPYYSMQDLGLEPGYEHYPAYEQRVQDLIAEHDLQAEYGTVKKGGAIIWHANLLHGGAPRNDMKRTRHSQVTHYYFDGCKYYTPMESRPGKLRYRQPFWIPQTEDFSLPPGSGASFSQRLMAKIKRTLGLG